MKNNSTSPMISRQPKALYVLFFAEFWERFSFYGLQASLILYAINHFKFDDATASLLYGSYVAINYATPVIGGFIADKLIGHQKAIIIGTLLLILGNLTLMISNPIYLYVGLAIITIGTGFFKSNISTLVGGLFSEDDPRRDSAFTIFYMGINLGGIFGSIFYGILATQLGWMAAFSMSAIGLAIGLLVFKRKQYLISQQIETIEQKNPVLASPITTKAMIALSPAILIAIIVASLLLVHSTITGFILEIFSALTFISLIGIAFLNEPLVRNRILALLLFSFYYLVWAASFFQIGGSLTLFIERNVDHHIFGLPVPTTAFFSIESIFIVMLAPLFVKLWTYLNKQQREPSIPAKFSIGLLLTAVSFGVLTLAAKQSITGPVSSLWIIIAYAIIAAGELSLSPIGLSAITRLAPKTLVSVFIGTWFLASSLAGYIAGLITKFASLPETNVVNDVKLAAENYAYTFHVIFWVLIAFGIMSVLLIPATKYLIKVR